MLAIFKVLALAYRNEACLSDRPTNVHGANTSYMHIYALFIYTYISKIEQLPAIYHVKVGLCISARLKKQISLRTLSVARRCIPIHMQLSITM